MNIRSCVQTGKAPVNAPGLFNLFLIFVSHLGIYAWMIQVYILVTMIELLSGQADQRLSC
jgi:hypothetical protein